MGARIAIAAATAGASVELVGRVGDDPTGDALVLALSQAGVGHVAVLRDSCRETTVVVPPDAAGDIAADDALVGAVDDDVDARPELPPTATLAAADIDLALRYLTASRALVIADELPVDALAVAADAAAYAGAHLIVVADGEPGVQLPGDATVLARPTSDVDGGFARLVGEYAAALDRGDDANAAFTAAVTGTGWERAGD